MRGGRVGLGLGLGGTLGGEGLAQALAGPGQQGARRDVADPQGGRQLDPGQVVELGQEERRALSFRDPGEGALHVARQVGIHDQALGRRRGSVRLPGPREEPDDLPAADLVEGHPMRDLVQPGAGVLGLLERLVVLVGLDERVLLRMLREPELAADLTQDAFIKAYKNYETLEKPENARAWLYQIAHRVALDEIRRRKIIRFFPWTGESHGSAPSAERLVMDAHLSGDMQRALARIPERQRAALLLAELHDLTGVELAAALGVSHVAARALLTRARESLRQALAAERAAEAEAEANATASHSPESHR